MSRPLQPWASHTADIRIGVTPVEHEVLDHAEAIQRVVIAAGSAFHLSDAVKAAQAALRANPQAGMGSRRRVKAIEAAARLLCALAELEAGR